MWQDNLPEDIAQAMWTGDTETLNEIAHCICCCYEHTWTTCPARFWNACRSGLAFGESSKREEDYFKNPEWYDDITFEY